MKMKNGATYMKRTLALTALLGSIATVPAFAAGPTMVEAEPAT